MDAASVKALLQAQLKECEFNVRGEGSHYEIEAIGEVFGGLRPVQKQQLVYAALKEKIGDGSIHAVNIRTYTQSEWQARAQA